MLWKLGRVGCKALFQRLERAFSNIHSGGWEEWAVNHCCVDLEQLAVIFCFGGWEQLAVRYTLEAGLGLLKITLTRGGDIGWEGVWFQRMMKWMCRGGSK